MVSPASLKNTVLQSIQTIYGADGEGRVLLAIGDVDVGFTPHAAWQAVATHQDGDVFAASDGTVVAAGVEGTTVRKVLVDSAGRQVVAHGPSGGLLTDRSGTITTGGTSQTLAASSLSRRYLLVQNQHDTEDLWIDFTTAAVVDKPSIRLGPLDVFVMEGDFVSTEAVKVIAATTGHKYTAKEG